MSMWRLDLSCHIAFYFHHLVLYFCVCVQIKNKTVQSHTNTQTPTHEYIHTVHTHIWLCAQQKTVISTTSKIFWFQDKYLYRRSGLEFELGLTVNVWLLSENVSETKIAVQTINLPHKLEWHYCNCTSVYRYSEIC